MGEGQIWFDAPKHSHRKAARTGERLHYDLFTSSVRAHNGAKYLLVIVDEYSDYVWAYGMKHKSETKRIVNIVMRKLERVTGRKVAAYRCDNAGENELDDENIARERTIIHTPHQNGKAERVGGVVWSGGQSFLFGGNLPSENWLHACLAFVHVRNRLPTSKWPARTPYDVMHALDGDNASMAEQVKRFRRLGSLCFVAVPHNILRQNGKNGRKSYRAMFLGYADQDGQKGYKVQRLQDGKVLTIAHAQLFKCHENRLVFERDESYDAWLRKKQKSIASKSMMDDVSDDSLSMISDEATLRSESSD